MRYAIVENNIVVNVAISDYPLDENWIADPDRMAQIGGEYNGAFHKAPEVLPSAQQYEDRVQRHLDEVAKSKGYDSILSACSYAGEVNQFQAESKQFITWRSQVWAYSYQVLQDVQNKVREAPTMNELIAELPVFGG